MDPEGMHIDSSLPGSPTNKLTLQRYGLLAFVNITSNVRPHSIQRVGDSDGRRLLLSSSSLLVIRRTRLANVGGDTQPSLEQSAS